MSIFGYYTETDFDKPAFDPGLHVVCPVCLLPLGYPMVTISLMKENDNKSYFYRVHKKCNSNIEAIREVESSLIDSI